MTGDALRPFASCASLRDRAFLTDLLARRASCCLPSMDLCENRVGTFRPGAPLVQ